MFSIETNSNNFTNQIGLIDQKANQITNYKYSSNELKLINSNFIQVSNSNFNVNTMANNFQQNNHNSFGDCDDERSQPINQNNRSFHDNQTNLHNKILSSFDKNFIKLERSNVFDVENISNYSIPISLNLYSLFKNLSPQFSRKVTDRMNGNVNILSNEIIIDSIDDCKLNNLNFQHSTDNNDSNDFYFSDLWAFYENPYGHEVNLYKSNVNNYYQYNIDNNLNNHDNKNNLENNYDITDSNSLFSENQNNNNEYEITTSFVAHLSAVQFYSLDGTLLFDFVETTAPHLRVPISHKIKELSKHFPLLLTGRKSQFNIEKSWFAINWTPIVVDLQMNSLLSGNFILYHSLDLQLENLCPLQYSTMFKQHLKNCFFNGNENSHLNDMNKMNVLNNSHDGNISSEHSSTINLDSPSIENLNPDNNCHCGGLCQLYENDSYSTSDSDSELLLNETDIDTRHQQDNDKSKFQQLFIHLEDDCCYLAVIGFACSKVNSLTWFNQYNRSKKITKSDFIKPLQIILTEQFDHSDLHHFIKSASR